MIAVAGLGHLAGARPTHDLSGAEALRRLQHDPRPPNLLLPAVPARDDRLPRARSAALASTVMPSRIPAPPIGGEYGPLC
jgi:hypothetical protein